MGRANSILPPVGGLVKGFSQILPLGTQNGVPETQSPSLTVAGRLGAHGLLGICTSTMRDHLQPQALEAQPKSEDKAYDQIPPLYIEGEFEGNCL